MHSPRSWTVCLHLASYGERWGRHWLDVVRYADTAGDNSDFPIPQMHRYRDWVISAFNRDLPYDQFVREQLAGDLLPGKTTQETHDRLIATGYIANARRFGSRVDDYPQHLTIEDTLDNLGQGLPRADHQLRALPRSQVRSHHRRRLLRALRHLSTARATRGRASSWSRSSATLCHSWKPASSPRLRQRGNPTTPRRVVWKRRCRS